jgi:HEAT repeat protein
MLSLADIERLFEDLEDESRPFRNSSLFGFSDLHGQGLAQFSEVFSGLTAERRRQLLRGLVELSEANYEVTFDAIFRLSLDDEDEVVRATAVGGLWENTSPSLIGPLLSLLRGDTSSQVRAAAAAGLGRFVLACEMEELEAPDEARIVDELMRTLRLGRETGEVRRRALESLAYACLPEVGEAIELAYYDEDEAMRQSAVLGMGRSCDRRWERVLLSELGSESPAMRYEAALACGGLGARKAVPALGRLLHDPDREIRYAAIWALGEIGGPEARQHMLDAYDGADEETEAALDDALAEQALFEDVALLDGDEDEPDGPLGDDDEDDEDDAWDIEGEAVDWGS